MAAPPAVITHGAAGILLLSDEVVRSLSDADTGHLEYLVPSRTSIVEGQEAPEFSGMRVQQVATRSEADEFIARCQVFGLMSGSSKIVKTSWSEDPHGWDVANVERIERTSASFAWKSALTGHTNMRLMGRAHEDMLDETWTRRQLVYRGIKAAGLVSRRIAVNGSVVQPSVPTEVGLPPIIFPAEKVNVSFPRITLTETIKTTVPPPTNRIPGTALTTLSGLPFPVVKHLPITSGPIVKNWPYGWVYSDMQPEELYAGAGLWVLSVTFEYVPPTQFG